MAVVRSTDYRPDAGGHGEAGAPAATRRPGGGAFHVASAAGPWGPIRVAASAEAVVGIAILSPLEPFVSDVVRRTGRQPGSGSNVLLERAVAAVEAFLDGNPGEVRGLPLDLADRGAWDQAVLGGVRGLGPGQITSYGRLAAAIGRPGAARAVGGAVGRNPIGLAIPCHRVIAGDGSIGGYGGDWFGSHEEMLEIKRELLAREGIALPFRFSHSGPRRASRGLCRSVHSAASAGPGKASRPRPDAEREATA